MGLESYRKKIDQIDEELIQKLEERMAVAEDIARYKKEHGLPVADYMRERALLQRVEERSAEGMGLYNRNVFSTLMEMSKDRQQAITDGDTELVKTIKAAIEETPRLFPEKVLAACQGVEGAYSQQACEKFFRSPRILYMKNFRGVFAAIEKGLCQYGVLPIENSSAGSVNQVYDLMMEYNFYIVKSMKMKVDHSLLVKRGTRREDIREIVSHEQALAQCEEYLKAMPGVKITVMENTAEAARFVAESDRTDLAAIASYTSGQLYNLMCLEESIQDSDNNYTRFICISRKPEIYPGANKTSFMMTVEHQPGALFHVLSRFYAVGINLEKLESRPIPSKDFEFMFYFDLECSVYADAFVQMMNQLEALSRDFKYLGSYMEV